MPDEPLPLYALLAKLFIERRDCKAIQRADGIYNPVNSKWTSSDIQDHLAGKKTYGHYLLDPVTNHARVLCFDIDLNKESRLEFRSKDEERIGWLTAELRCFANSISDKITELLDIPTAQLFSGNKGVHVYGFTGSAPAGSIREAGKLVIESFLKPSSSEPEFTALRGENFYNHYSYPEIEIEIFPKQDSVENGHFGNLLRLPLGIHRKSGRESFFYDRQASLWEFVPVNPEKVLGDLI